MQDKSDLRPPWQRTPPSVLYHYTGQEGLLGIIETKAIWASKIHYLNDYKEFQLGLEIAQRVANSRKSLNHSVSCSLIECLDGIKQTNICVCSFSEAGDLLSQWRAYCPQGAGFSIGFASQELRSLASRHGFRLIKCEYSPDIQYKLIESLIDTEFRKNTSAAPEQVSWEIAKVVAIYSAGMKHLSFSEEREWRLVSTMIDSRNPNFGFRTGQSVIVPYFKLDLADSNSRLPIARVVIGPTPHPDLGLDSVCMLLATKNPAGWQLENSTIPYRNW